MFEMSEEIQGGAVRNLHKDLKGEEKRVILIGCQ